MARLEEIEITLPGQRRVDARVRGHLIHTDQLVEYGGEDAAPMPFELFLASMGTCVGVTVQGFCAKRDLPVEGLSVTQRMRYGDDGSLAAVEFDVHLPPGFPEKYREAVVRVAGQCSVKRAIAAQPAFEVRTVGG